MKKSLFIIATIFSIFFITDRVDALTYENNGETIEVTKDNFIYYVYQNFTSYFDEYQYFVVSNDLDWNKYYNVFLSNCKFEYNSGYSYKNPGNCNYIRISSTSLSKEFNVNGPMNYPNISMGSPQYLIYSNYDIIKNGDTSIIFNANITKNDLEIGGKKPIYIINYYINNEIYQTFEVEKGSSHDLLNYSYNSDTHIFSGWQYDETLDFTNITSDITINATLEKKDVIPVYIEFPINKNEFYTLLVEVGVLIMIIFLKWCFPFKGGSDLK